MKARILLLALALACDQDGDYVCDCPSAPEQHPTGTLVSIVGGRTLTITDGIVEVRGNDGSTVRYRLLVPPRNEYVRSVRGPEHCPRPANFGRRTFEMFSSGETVDVFRIRAEGGNRLIDETAATATNVYGNYQAETHRAADGSVIDVLIDLTSGPTILAAINVSLTWTIETPTGERIPDGVSVQLSRSGVCQAVPCPDIGQLILPTDIRCH